METELLTADAYRHALALRDLTDPAHGPHAMQLLAAEIVRSLGGRGTATFSCIAHRRSCRSKTTTGDSATLAMRPPGMRATRAM